MSSNCAPNWQNPERACRRKCWSLFPEEGKLFHAPGCDYIREKTGLRTLTAAEASREGYAPCVRCMKKYLASARTNSKIDIVIRGTSNPI